MSGSPAFDNSIWLRSVAAFPKLPDILRKIRELEKQLERLKGLPASQNSK
jgi:UDP-3-O-[3-hydroxymyristoyl] glucosamine N-acyltransferase